MCTLLLLYRYVYADWAKDKLIEFITPCLVVSLLQHNTSSELTRAHVRLPSILASVVVLHLVVCASDVVVMAIAGMSSSGIWPSDRGGCIVSGCIAMALLAVLGLCLGIRPVHSGASVAGVVAWPNGASARGCHLCISGVADSLVASPEWRTRCVVVGWRWAVSLFLIMMSDEEDLENGRDDEEEDVDDCNGEDSCLEAISLT
jgi:hypothetical protein